MKSENMVKLIVKAQDIVFNVPAVHHYPQGGQIVAFEVVLRRLFADFKEESEVMPDAVQRAKYAAP